ncbi:MAG: hypothetical protein LBB67_07450 [Oscillospiraceae bacterium]|jgi:hypothetical protein|nr:hypothetical protein [Oscillospiraceae bacterium]
MKKKRTILICVICVLLAAAVVAVIAISTANADKKSTLPETLPDSGVLAIAVAADASIDLDKDNVRLFEDEDAIKKFMADYHLRSSEDKLDMHAEFDLPNSFDFEKNMILFCYTSLSSDFSLKECYYEQNGGSVAVSATAVITDEAKRYYNPLPQGFLLAIPKERWNDGASVRFAVTEQKLGETTTDPYAGIAKLELKQEVTSGGEDILVRVVFDEASKHAPIESATYFSLQEYTGYKWRTTMLLDGILPTDVRVETQSKVDFLLKMDVYAPLTVGKQYRVVLQLHLEDGITLNAAVTFEVTR